MCVCVPDMQMLSQEGAKALLVKLPLSSPRSPPRSEMDGLQQSAALGQQRTPAATGSRILPPHQQPPTNAPPPTLQAT